MSEFESHDPTDETAPAGESDPSGLLIRCLQGESAAIVEFVERYERLVYRVCWRILGHHQDAEDVSQDVFVRALQGLPGFDLSRRLEPWLLTIAVNRCRTALTRRRNRLQTSEVPIEAVCAEGTAGTGDLAEELELALRGLRDDHRLVFVLFHDQQLNLNEIAQLTGHPVGTIKTWLHRSRRALAAHLASRGIVPAHAHDLR